MSIIRHVYHVPKPCLACDWDCCWFPPLPPMPLISLPPLPPPPSLPPMSCCGCPAMPDPMFDDFQRMLARKNQMWMDRPCMDCSPPLKLTIKGPSPAKYRVSIDCQGYDPKSIKTEIKDGKLNISGSEKNDSNGVDYSMKEFRKTFSLPENAETDKMTTSMTPCNQMIVEMPLKSKTPAAAIKDDGSPFPQIVENEKGQKMVSFRLNMPKNIDPSKINVKYRDRELVVEAKDKIEKDNSRSSTSYYQRTTLPENTDLNGIKCVFDNEQLAITAPMGSDFVDGKTIPVEYKK